MIVIWYFIYRPLYLIRVILWALASFLFSVGVGLMLQSGDVGINHYYRGLFNSNDDAMLKYGIYFILVGAFLLIVDRIWAIVNSAKKSKAINHGKTILFIKLFIITRYFGLGIGSFMFSIGLGMMHIGRFSDISFNHYYMYIGGDSDLIRYGFIVTIISVITLVISLIDLFTHEKSLNGNLK